ncbi:MAG: FAD-dependent oxidoreductase [Oligoflexia bacterium]|nr:FAD-dependent oxidoreductase [Oligoflexia bacterium]MBF0364010.1 FAD-dependent oxidoreductase [Oligoflexia bacterium]
MREFMVGPFKTVIHAVVAMTVLLSFVSGAFAGKKVITSNLKEEYNPELRVAIIGAGISGLVAAHTLKEMGYKNVTVFEKDDEVGGKIHTHEMNDKIYDLGAVWVSGNYDNVRQLAKQFNVDLIKAKDLKVADLKDKSEMTTNEYLLQHYSKSDILKAFYRLGKLMSHNHTATAGLSLQEDPDLALPFGEYIKRKKIEPFAKTFQPLVVGCGYGFYEEIPALYIMKIINQGFNNAIEGVLKFWQNRESSYVKKGYQEILRQVAKKLDVRTNSLVSKIEREVMPNGDLAKIKITAGDKSYEFDRVVITHPPNAAKDMMNLSDEEKLLFSQVETYSYYVILSEVEGLDPSEWDGRAIIENTGIDKAGHAIILANPYHEDKSIFLSWHLSPQGSLSDDEVILSLNEDLAKVGGNLKKIILIKKYDNYFPHVKTEALQGNFANDPAASVVAPPEQDFYQRLNSLQGKNGTYYVGGLMNFESAEHSADFATKLMKHHFKK